MNQLISIEFYRYKKSNVEIRAKENDGAASSIKSWSDLVMQNGKSLTAYKILAKSHFMKNCPTSNVGL